MKTTTILTTIALSITFGLSAACSSETTKTPTKDNVNAANPANNTGAETAKKEEETPAGIKAAFADAESFTKQHKDIPKDKIAEIEKDTGTKVPDTDHHSYLAFATKDGKRTQIGAATIVKVDGKEVVIVYENKEGSPYVKEVRAEGVAPAFLKQFAGKGHDDDLLLGADIKANGYDEAKAKAFTEAVRVDVLTMQALYGAAHSH